MSSRNPTCGWPRCLGTRIAALRDHRRVDRDLDARIAAANPAEAARLRAQRSRLRGAGLWKPTIPGEREAKAICRYLGRLRPDHSRSRGAIEKRKNKPTFMPGIAVFLRGREALQPPVSDQLSSGRHSSRIAAIATAPASFYSPSERSDRGRDAKTKPLLGIAEKWPRALRGASAQRFDDPASQRSGPEALRGASASNWRRRQSFPMKPKMKKKPSSVQCSRAIVMRDAAPRRRQQR